MSSIDISPLLEDNAAMEEPEDILDLDEDELVQRSEELPDDPEQRNNNTTKLFSLPDEALFNIFAKLITTKRGNILREPFGAVSLAESHSRLLRIFGGLITHVTTDVYQGDVSPFMLLPRPFFLKVMPFVGFSLRALCLDNLGCGSVTNLARCCPNLESFSYTQRNCDCNGCMKTFSDVLTLPIRALSLSCPTAKCLRRIRTTPPELSILRCDYKSFDELCRILRDPPRQLKVDLDFHCNSYHIKEDHGKIMSALCEACPKIEALTMTTDILTVLDNKKIPAFVEKANVLISEARNNTIESKCRSLSVEGDAAIPLLKRVHPKAAIQMGCFRSGIIYDRGDGIGFVKLYLNNDFPDMDFSSTSEVVITSACNPSWKNALKDLKLTKAEVEDVSKANDMCFDIEVVEMDYSLVRPNEWGWLKKVRELHLTDRANYMNLQDIPDFVRGLTQIFDIFNGDLYWFVETCQLRLRNKPRDPAAEKQLQQDFRALDSAVDRYDDRTRSGQAIRGVVEWIQICLHMCDKRVFHTIHQ